MIDTDDDNLWRVNLFEILGVEADADEKAIRQVYKKLAKKYHPDRYPAGSPAQEGARDKFSDISRAYEILGNDQKRRQYLDTRRLLAEHLPEDQRPAPEVPAETPPSQSNSGSEPVKPKAAKKTESAPQRSAPASTSKGEKDKSLDYKRKEAEEAAKEAKVFLRKNKLEDAISLYQRAISLMPDNSEYHSSLGQVYSQRGWTGMAQAAYKNALVINPQDPIAKKNYEPEKPKKKGLFGGIKNMFKKD